MKRFRIPLSAILALLLAGAPLAAQDAPLVFSRSDPLGAQTIIYPDDWVLDALTALALEQGKIFFTSSSITIAELEKALAEIDDETLSRPGKVLYQKVRDYLAAPRFISLRSDIFSLTMGARLEPELYYKTNDDLDWAYSRNERRPFLYAPAELSFSSYIAMGADLYLGENRALSLADDNYFNFPFDTMIDGVQSIDTNIPRRAYFSAGVPLGRASGINFRIGIGDDTIGRTETGSVILSDHLKGKSYGRLSLYSPAIRYSANIEQFEVNKYLYLHRFEALFFDRLALGLAEGAMVNAPLELRFLNPMMIFHGFAAWSNYEDYNKTLLGGDLLDQGDSRVGSLLGITADFKPGKFFHIYALYAMNQIKAPGEDGSSTTPDAMAFQLGAETVFPVSSGRWFDGYWKIGLEGVYTYPYMYILRDKGWSFYRESQEVSNNPFPEWAGSPFGADTAAAFFWTEFHPLSTWSVRLSFLFAAQGENSDADFFSREYNLKEENSNAVAPSGKPIYTYQTGIDVSWNPRAWIALTFRPAYTVQTQYNRESGRTEQGFEISATCRITPPAIAWRGR